MYNVKCVDLTPAQRERVVLLIEECGEVIQEACKILRFGYQDCHPTTFIDNTTSFHQEVGDLLAILKVMEKAGDYIPQRAESHIAPKLKRLVKFTRFQPQLEGMKDLGDWM